MLSQTNESAKSPAPVCGLFITHSRCVLLMHLPLLEEGRASSPPVQVQPAYEPHLDSCMWRSSPPIGKILHLKNLSANFPFGKSLTKLLQKPRSAKTGTAKWLPAEASLLLWEISLLLPSLSLLVSCWGTCTLTLFGSLSLRIQGPWWRGESRLLKEKINGRRKGEEERVDK